MTAALILVAVAWVSPAQVEELPTPMDPNALYAALNTIAQCAAALAALIGFLGLWRLDRLRDEVRQCVQTLFVLNLRISQSGASANILPDEVIVRAANDHIKFWETLLPTQQAADQYRGEWTRQLQGELDRREDLLHEQRGLMRVLSVFPVVTLACILPAIVGIVHADWLKTWTWTPWLLYIAGAWLTAAPAYVVWQAARSIRTLAADPGRCTSYYKTTMNRWQTVCADGTRSTSTWSPALRQWQTTITPPPGKTCTSHQTGRGLQGRCR